jgi:hypothetical protein
MESTKLWKHGKHKRLIKKKNNGKLVICWVCPCCEPKVIASAITNSSNRTWNLRPYQGERVGLPGARWRIRDVGQAHHNSSTANCSGTRYQSGVVDENGKLQGLPDEFVSNYSYNGYMQLQQGCVQEDGSIKWTCPNG